MKGISGFTLFLVYNALKFSRFGFVETNLIPNKTIVFYWLWDKTLILY